MHLESGWKQVVHDHDPNVLGVAAVAVEAKELGQERPRILLEIHEVA